MALFLILLGKESGSWRSTMGAAMAGICGAFDTYAGDFSPLPGS